MSQKALELIDIPVNSIKPSPYQPRLDFDLEELRGSILKYGIRDPLKVRKVEDYWELIDGERRLRIAKQEGIETVPCIVLEYSDEEADALSWRFNTERKDYSIEEKAKHFRKHQLEGMSGRAIGRIHGYHHRTVNSYLSIFRLPEKHQNYIWAGKFSFQKFEYLYEKGLVNSNTGAPPPHAINLIQQSIDQDLKQKEFEKVTDRFILDLREKQVEAAKKVAVAIDATQRRIDLARGALGEPEVKPPETPEEFEAAAKTLQKRAEEVKTPEQKLAEAKDKVRKSLLTGKANIPSKIEKAKELGIDTSDFERRLDDIKDKIEIDPEEAMEETKKLRKDVDSARKADEERRKRERVREEEREKAEEKRLKDLVKEHPEAAQEAIMDARTDQLKRGLGQQVEELTEGELYELKKILEDEQERIKEKMKDPKIMERGRLFKDLMAHGIILQYTDVLFCPSCNENSGVLKWGCCDKSVEDAYEELSSKF